MEITVAYLLGDRSFSTPSVKQGISDFDQSKKCFPAVVNPVPEGFSLLFSSFLTGDPCPIQNSDQDACGFVQSSPENL